jgi:pimeloyl-ACP methyl ester carboxylesterase
MAFIAPALPVSPALSRSRANQEFREPRESYIGWGMFNQHYWSDHYGEFLDFFFAQCLSEPHSTKPHEDTVGWGLETDAPTLVATQLAPRLQREADVRALLSRIDCPILVIHGSDDQVRPCASGARFAELAHGALAVLEGAGHLPHARDPVKVNLLLRDFISTLGRDRR